MVLHKCRLKKKNLEIFVPNREIGRFSLSFKKSADLQGPVSRSPCVLLKLDFLTNACILLPALVRNYRLVRRVGFAKPAPAKSGDVEAPLFCAWLRCSTGRGGASDVAATC